MLDTTACAGNPDRLGVCVELAEDAWVAEIVTVLLADCEGVALRVRPVVMDWVLEPLTLSLPVPVRDCVHDDDNARNGDVDVKIAV